MKILITAGPTCEDIDPVRFISNRSSGRTGYAIAAEAARRDHEVVLVSGPTSLEPPPSVRIVNVRSAADMLAACLQEFDNCGAAVFVAAVCDYKPVDYSPAKITKGADDLLLPLTRTDDIAERLGQAKTNQFLVGFALETDDGHAAAERKLRSKNWNAVVLNHPDTFGGEHIGVELLARDASWDNLGQVTKAAFASKLLDAIERHPQTGS